ncbi:regulatory factor X-associated protein-like isoform X1 [Acipenser oxyrinchus oxyrinchus]|uniref:Regulatory factor X-associated protein-like isoform X1 n=1 Tax=Acipenser oxyrinchus oxyrinchus TaxID=40147 RepID=A0AAD8CHT6_ACIOX|nr:regulatory factor X-associated protein-like isoform X1 [Acipenser oxyrinchus oxyrinchus]
MSEEGNTKNMNTETNISVVVTQDVNTYYAGNSTPVETRANITTPQEPENMVLYEIGDDPGEESDVLDTSDPRDSTASPEELNDDEAFGDETVTKPCTYEGCTETTTQVAKQRKPWMCKKHRNKMYKDKYKKKKNDQAITSTGKLDCESHSEGVVFSFEQDSADERPVSVTKQHLGTIGDRPARPSLLEQVLNQKGWSLLRSPEVMSFLQQQQWLLTNQAQGQRQQEF